MLVHERLWSNYFNFAEGKINISDIFGKSCNSKLADVHSAIKLVNTRLRARFLFLPTNLPINKNLLTTVGNMFAVLHLIFYQISFEIPKGK